MIRFKRECPCTHVHGWSGVNFLSVQWHFFFLNSIFFFNTLNASFLHYCVRFIIFFSSTSSLTLLYILLANPLWDLQWEKIISRCDRCNFISVTGLQLREMLWLHLTLSVFLSVTFINSCRWSIHRDTIHKIRNMRFDMRLKHLKWYHM